MNELQHINSANYETWFLWFVDGALSDVQKQMVLDFIIEHPHLQKELDELKKTINEADNIQFDKKENLLHISDEALLLYLDKELPKGDATWLESSLNKKVQKRIEDLKKVYNQPDESIVFEGKEKLYKQAKVISIFKTGHKVAAAAAVALIVVCAWFVINRNEKASSNMAVTDVQKNVSLPQKINKDTEIVSDSNETRQLLTNLPSTENKERENNSSTEIKAAKNSEKTRTVLIAKGGNKKINEQPVGAIANDGNEIKKIVIPPAQNKDIAVVNTYDNNSAIAVATPSVNTAITASNGALDNNGVAFASNTNADTRKKKSFFKHIGNEIKNRALDILTDGGEDINVAGFAVNVSR